MHNTPYPGSGPVHNAPYPNTSFPPSATHEHTNKLLRPQTLNNMNMRPKVALTKLGQCVVDTRKGLSRVLTASQDDLSLFARELMTSNTRALEPHWQTHNWDDIPTFAVSYVHHEGRGFYRFSEQQWRNLTNAINKIAESGVQHFRLWLDQCYIMRGHESSSWAQIGIVPYVIWPVISLGVKWLNSDRTESSYKRMWPFLEEISALWGMGIIIASEHASYNPTEGFKPSISYDVRRMLSPEKTMALVLTNMFHGAADKLATSAATDKQELNDLARSNILTNSSDVVVGYDWRQRLDAKPPADAQSVLEYLSGKLDCNKQTGRGIYLDGSKKLTCNTWSGIAEWMSGNDNPSRPYRVPYNWQQRFDMSLDKYSIFTNLGEFQLLCDKAPAPQLWMLVAMRGQSYEFSHGKVEWTKIVTGPSTSTLRFNLENDDYRALECTLREEVGASLKIDSCKSMNGRSIEWS